MKKLWEGTVKNGELYLRKFSVSEDFWSVYKKLKAQDEKPKWLSAGKDKQTGEWAALIWSDDEESGRAHEDLLMSWMQLQAGRPKPPDTRQCAYCQRILECSMIEAEDGQMYPCCATCA